MLCVLFSALLVATNPPKNISNYFLAAFLLTHACIPLHELMMWGAEFKHTVRDNFPQIYFVGSFAYYIDAALLYFYVKALIFRDFHLRKKDYYHLIPITLFAIFMIATYFRFPLPQRMEWINNETFVYGAPYITSDFMCKILRVVYCVACFHLILKYKALLKATHSNLEKVNVFWLKLLVVGFLTVTIMEAFLSLSKFIGVVIHFDFQHVSLAFFEFVGLSGYYVTFILVCMLVFTSMRYFANFEAIRQKKEPEPVKKPVQEKLLNPEYAEKIDSVMRSEKPYLMADVTLDMLAEKLAIPARDLSMIINRHFDNNFYEFINNYRIEEAKKILIDPKNKDKTITDIYLEVGFNSKSVFNTFFKKIVGLTPSEYRQVRHAPELPN
jgi:AraC-like DNA-binding protein